MSVPIDDGPARPARPVLATAARVLTFRASRDEMLGLGRPHLVFGLVATWLVGIGRYWDSPDARLLQHAGLGSVVYVFVLAAILVGIVRPLGAPDWTYGRVLTLVSLVAPPAALYAIPVERFMERTEAESANVWFLAAVAAWRVALLFFFLRRVAALPWGRTFVAGLLPLVCIVTALSFLNVEHAVFDLMGGGNRRTANDGAYAVVLAMTLVSWILVLPLFGFYTAMALRTRRARRSRPA